MWSGQVSGVPISTIAAFSTGFGLSFLYCTMHPSGSRASGPFSPWRRRVAQRRGIQPLEAKQPGVFPPWLPVHFCGPRKPSVPGRVQKGSTFMVEGQHCVAHGVVSKDGGLGSMSGVERLTNQQPGYSSIKSGSPFQPNQIIGTFCPP